ncbi:MAG: hypothetical protein R3343_11240, partial [Nitriliruptorales bacterium]|nr:hypothetical protein [Nitriliruptorales bacterium]
AVARRLGLPASSIALVERMVELHLLLPVTATRRDLSDPDVIEEVARSIRDRETLACLHLLAAADGIATGPSAWSDWTAALVEQLVVRVRATLDRDSRNDLADRAMATAREAQRIALIDGGDAERVRAHLAALPMRYATVVPPDVVVGHADLAAAIDGHDLAATVFDADGVTRLLVAARDRPGLLATVAGTVSVNRGSVLEAHAHTRSDGIAVQFLVLAPPDPPEPDWHERLESALHDPVHPDELADAVARRRGYARDPAAAAEVDTHVTIEDTPRATVVELQTRDRPGLLHLAARLFTDLGYDIDSVKASVQGPRVIDTFYVRRRDGRPVDGEAETELELAFLSELGDSGVTGPLNEPSSPPAEP